jgi:hypothetical protein
MNTVSFRRFVPALLAGSVAALFGCSGKGPGDYAHVAGTVTHNGVAVEGAKVTFVSTTEAKGQAQESFSTTTDSSGKYMIAGYGRNPGIPPGMYKVTISKLVMKNGKAPASDDGFDSTQLELSGMGKNLLPKEYAEVGTTKLTATLDTGKNKDVNFDLKGK